MENKKQGKGLVVALVMFIIICLGLIAYILYDKGIILEKEEVTKQEITEKKTEQVKEKELDINSRLVKSLYNKVYNGDKYQEGCYMNYIYAHGEIGKYSDFIVDTATEKEKMVIVGLNINEKEQTYIDCSQYESQIPDVQGEVHRSICRNNKDHNTSDLEVTYSKEYIESVYKDIYGQDAKLDTTVPIEMSVVGVERYYYVPAINKYVKYVVEGGGTCGPNGNTEKLVKATSNGNEVLIYAEVDEITYEANAQGVYVIEDTYKKENKYVVVYKFQKEEDGMYSFVSRTKEK